MGCCCSGRIGKDIPCEIPEHAVPPIRFSVIGPSGKEVASLSLPDAAGLEEVLAAVRQKTGRQRLHAKVLHGSQVLSHGLSLQDIGVVEGSRLTIVVMRIFDVAVLREGGHAVELHTAGIAGEGLRTWRVDHRVESMAFSPDGTLLLTVYGRVPALWNTATGERLRTLPGHEGRVGSAAFSRDGAHVLTGSSDSTARIWCVATGECCLTLRGHPGDEASVSAAAFSPVDLEVVTGSKLTTAKVWSVTTGEVLRTLSGHSKAVVAAGFSSDGALIVTASDDGSARIWASSTGRCVHILNDHDLTFSAASFSPDGSKVLTASIDRAFRHVAKVWSATTGRCSLTLCGHEARVMSASFSADGLDVLTGSLDGTARVWKASDGECWCAMEAFGGIAVARGVL